MSIDDRYCQNCGRLLPEDWDSDYCSKCLDEEATYIIHSPLNPGLR